jgi:hypothetical protein
MQGKIRWKMLHKILRKVLRKIFHKLLRKMLHKILRKVLRKIRSKMRGENLRKFFMKESCGTSMAINSQLGLALSEQCSQKKLQ